MESILYDSKNSATYRFGLHLLDFVPRDRSQSIIDIGSGSGALTRELMFYAGDVIGVDKDIRTVARASQKYPTVTFYVMDALRLQYENRFDIAFSNATFHEVEDKAKLLSSILKCLRPGGKLVAEFPASDCSVQYFEELDRVLATHGIENGRAYHFIDKRACHALLEQSGFEIERLVHYRRNVNLRCDRDIVREDILSTINRQVPSDMREAVADEMMEYVDRTFAIKNGYTRGIARLQIVASKPFSE